MMRCLLIKYESFCRLTVALLDSTCSTGGGLCCHRDQRGIKLHKFSTKGTYAISSRKEATNTRRIFFEKKRTLLLKIVLTVDSALPISVRPEFVAMASEEYIRNTAVATAVAVISVPIYYKLFKSSKPEEEVKNDEPGGRPRLSRRPCK